MASRSYSFIDVAVLDPVRARFAAGEALLILSPALDEIIWANGPGAQLLGFQGFADSIGADPALPFAARRQIGSLPGYPALTGERTLAVRLANGLSSRAVAFSAQSVRMPDGETALLLVAREADGENRSEAAARAISGLSDEGQFVAMVGPAGRIEASSPGFEAVRLEQTALDELVRDIAGEDDRLVKRMVPAAGGRRVAAGMARLCDEPLACLLMIVAEAEQETTESIAAAPSDVAEPALRDEPQDTSPDEAEPSAHASHADDHWYFNGESRGHGAPTPPATDTETQPAAQGQPAGPVRFVWKTDAEGRFSMIGDPFRAAVGNAVTDVVGRSFREVAQAFGLDPDGEIAGLLERRDTWSGRTVHWPVSDTTSRVPVDLAALPVYGRERNFEGFRGFGVARMGDLMADEGMASAQPRSRRRENEAKPAGDRMPPQATEDDDPFQDEAPMPDAFSARPAWDKVIKLAERRQAAPEKALSNSERLNFREIGDRLRQAGLLASEELVKSSGTASRTDELEANGDGPDDLQPAAPAADVPGDHDGTKRAETDYAAEASASEPAHGSVNATPETADDTQSSPFAAKEEPVPTSPDEPSSGASDEARMPGEEAASGTEDAETDPAPATGPESAEADHPQFAAAHAMTSRDVRAKLRRDGMAALVKTFGADTSDADGGRTADDATAAAPDRPESSVAPDLEEAAATGTAEERAATDAAQPVQRAHGSDAEARRPAPLSDAFLPSAFGSFERLPGVDAVLLSGLPLPLLIHSGDTLHYANREFLQLTGYVSLEALARAGGLGAIFAEPCGEADGRKPALRTSGGEEFPVDAFLQSVDWNGGKALLLAVKRIEAAQPASVGAPVMAPPPAEDTDARIAELRTIIDTATDGVVLIANDGTIRSISRPAEALFGFDSDQVVGRHFETLFATESQRAARDYLAGLAENGVMSVLNDGRELIGRESQGRFIPLFMTIGRLPGESGFCAVVRDITQWKRAEEELTQARTRAERASSQKTDFLARVSHEIRTPLNAIIGFSELMIDEKFGPISNERYRDYMRDINRSGNHVLDLVNDLLDISKIEAGEQEMTYEAVSLNDVLGESVALMQPQANRERVIIRSSFASRLPEVVADLRSVRQIALNLLSNAVRYTNAGGQVIVSTSLESSGDIVMRVRDTGVGMTPAEVEQALKPFKQINTIKRPRGGGTGLGLPLTKAMVEANRARFAIHSNPGEGTLVEIVFPSTRVLAH